MSRTRKPKLLTSPNFLERELGTLTPEQSKRVRAVLSNFMAEFRAILRPALRYLRAHDPSCEGPCSSCASLPRTDSWPGFAPTAYGLLTAIRDGKVFICHDNQPGWEDRRIDPTKVKICRAFVLVKVVDQETIQKAAKRAHAHIQKIVSVSQ